MANPRTGNCYDTFQENHRNGTRGENLVCTASVRSIVNRLLSIAREYPDGGCDFMLIGQKVEVKTDMQLRLPSKKYPNGTGNFCFEVRVKGNAGLLTYPPKQRPHIVGYYVVTNAKTFAGICYWFDYAPLVAWIMDGKEQALRDRRWRFIHPNGDEGASSILVPDHEVFAQRGGCLLDAWSLDVG